MLRVNGRQHWWKLPLCAYEGELRFFDSKDGLRNVQSYSTLEEEIYRGLVWTLGPPREETLEEEKENRPIFTHRNG